MLLDRALALMLTTMIGAGVLALPKVLALSWPYALILVPFIVFVLYLTGSIVVELHSKMKGPSQLPTLISKFLGEKLKFPAYLFIVLSMYGALTAYLFGINKILNISPVFLAILMFFIGFFAVTLGTEFVSSISKYSAHLVVTLLFVLGLLNTYTVLSRGAVMPEGSLNAVFDFSAAFLFSLFGLNVLPEVNYLSKGRGKEIYLKALLICLGLYLFYAISTVLLLGNSIDELSTYSLAGFYGNLGFLFSLFTLLAMFFPYLGLGLSLRHIYEFDLDVPRPLSSFAVYLPPAVIFLISSGFGGSFLSFLLAVGQFTLPVFILMLITAYISMVNSRGRMEEPWVYVLLFTYAAMATKFLLTFLNVLQK